MNGASRRKVIVASARDRMPGCCGRLKATKDYQIVVVGNTIAVCGFDDRGAMYGLYNLMMWFSLSEGPYCPGIDTVRHSLYRAADRPPPGLGWMEWPDRYVATLPLYGFDALHFSIYRNPNNAPGAEPYWSDAVMRRHKPGA